MISIALCQPEIPPNTGNVIRLCANSGADLHLIGPLGFSMDDKQLRRAGLDYHEYCAVKVWENWDEFAQSVTGRLISLSTRHSQSYADFEYADGDICVFGSESSGLPDFIRRQIPDENQLTIPMRENSRSLNLSNSVAIVLYESWRQAGFA